MIAATCHTDRPHYGKALCKPCYMREYNRANRLHIAAKKREYYRADPQRYIDNSRKSLYGITGEEYRRRVAAQEGRCAICDRVPRRSLVVDHDHQTGAIRGLICQECNRGIGFLGDDLQRVRSAARYLEGER